MNYLKSNQFSQELGTNSIADQYLTLEKQLDKLNLSNNIDLDNLFNDILFRYFKSNKNSSL